MYFNGLFRRNKMPATVNMGLEFHSIFGYFIQQPQGKNLKPAAVSKNWPVPIHKFMKTSCLPYKLMPRTKIKMIGIRKNNLGVHLFKLTGIHSLNRCLSSYRHVYRRFNISMGRMKYSRPCSRIFTGFYNFKAKIIIHVIPLQLYYVIYKN